MSYRIFYSYQSDSPKVLNEHFIGEAIDAAKKRIKGVDIEIVKGFSGISGNKPLAATMFDQSRTSDLFIGDVTFTMAKEWHKYIEKVEGEDSIIIEIPKGNLKPSPNPNVLMETGYSWCHKDYDRTILVINTAFGNPKDLPADFGDLRWPIAYNLGIEKYKDQPAREREFEELTKQLVGAIKAGLETSREYQRKKFYPLKQYINWSRPDFKTEFFLTDELGKILEKMRWNLLEKNKPLRLIGPKSSGRSRLAWQFLRRNKPILSRHEAIERIFYYPDGGEYMSIARQILELRELNQEHIIILDNCSLKIHNRLCEDLDGSNLKILTIGDTTDTCEDNDATIRISDKVVDSLISSIIRSKHSEEQALKFITKADGNVSRACSYISSEIEEIDIDDDNEIWKKLLGEYHANDDANKILALLSLFSHVGYNDQYAQQADFIRRFASTMTNAQFYSFIEMMFRRGIIRIIGDFIHIESFQDRLYKSALDYLKTIQLDNLIRYISNNGLLRQFVDQLHNFKGSETVDYILAEISKEGRLLTDFDFVDSNGGSEFALGVVDLLPSAVLTGIQKTVGELEIEKLKGFKDGRRNIVWALEYLASKNEYFNDAAQLLYRLALAENESISNNASGQFRRLFQAKQASTEVDLKVRMDFMNQLVNENGTLDIVLISVLNSALVTQGWVGFGITTRNVEIKFKSYEPNHKELSWYWGESIKLLEQAKAEAANKILFDNFRSQFIQGNKEAIWDAVVEIFKTEEGISEEWRSQLDMLVLEKRVDSADKGRISELINSYVSDKTRDNLKYKVALAPYSVSKVNNKRIDNSQEAANHIANELFENDQFTWLEHMHILLEGEQRKTLEFGRTCAVLKPGNDEFIELIIQNLSKIEPSVQNSSLILGYLSETNDSDFTRKTIDKFSENEKVDFHAVRITKLIEPSLSELKKLYPIFEKYPNLVPEFQSTNLTHLKEGELICFIQWLMSKNLAQWWWSAIDICEYHFKGDGKWSDEIIDLINSLLKKPGLVKGEGLHGWSSFFSHVELIRHLSKYRIEEETVVTICRDIVSLAEEFSISNTFDLTDILSVLFRTNWDVAWPIISVELLNGQLYIGYELKDILRGTLEEVDDQILIEWMTANPDKAPQRIMEIINFQERQGDSVDFTPLVKEMLKRYSSNDEFLSTFSSRLHSYGISGSAVPINKQRKELMSQLFDGYPEKIQEFATTQIEYFKRVIEQEKRNDANWSLRF